MRLELENLKSPRSALQMDLWSHIFLKVMVFICIYFAFAKMHQMFVLALVFNFSLKKRGQIGLFRLFETLVIKINILWHEIPKP